MHLEHFQYLLEINKHHSISAAARALYMGQTTLSSIVKSVESQLGFPVFQRAPSGVVATANGERLMALAWEIGVKYEELLHLKDRKTNASLPIVVPLAPSINVGACLPIMERFYATDTNSTLIFDECPRLDIGTQIIQNNANIGITYLRPDEVAGLAELYEKNKINTKILFRDKFYLAVSKRHHLAGRTSVTLGELYDERLAMATVFRVAADTKMLASLNRNSTRLTSFPMIHMIKEAILEQDMAAILTGYALANDLCYTADAFRILELTEMDSENAWDVCLLYRAQKNLRYPEKTLLLCIEEYFEQLNMPLPA